MNWYQILIVMPSDEELTLLPLDAQYLIRLLQTLYPSKLAPNTNIDSDKKLLYCVIAIDSTDPLTVIEAMIKTFDDLNWVVGGFQAAWSDEKSVAFKPRGQMRSLWIWIPP